MADSIKDNLEKIKKELGQNVKLVAVTKTVATDKIMYLKSLGVDDFGENRVKDAEPKIKEINATWHFIGHLQSNKAKKCVELFDVIESVDSIGIAEIISKECEKQNKIMPILLQVNIAKEPQKQGFQTEEIENALKEISKLKNTRIDGFMMIAPFVEPEKTRPYFKQAKQLFDKYKSKYSLKWLSMGMSNDYKIAIQEGANMVRIGARIFD